MGSFFYRLAAEAETVIGWRWFRKSEEKGLVFLYRNLCFSVLNEFEISLMMGKSSSVLLKWRGESMGSAFVFSAIFRISV